jgi:hypothetical protein
MESCRLQVPLLHRQTQVLGECSIIYNLSSTPSPLIPVSFPATYTQSVLLSTLCLKISPLFSVFFAALLVMSLDLKIVINIGTHTAAC